MHSAKWDTMDRECYVQDLIQMGVADMDFQTPRPVLDAVQSVLDKGVL